MSGLFCTGDAVVYGKKYREKAIIARYVTDRYITDDGLIMWKGKRREEIQKIFTDEYRRKNHCGEKDRLIYISGWRKPNH